MKTREEVEVDFIETSEYKFTKDKWGAYAYLITQLLLDIRDLLAKDK